MRGEVFTSVLSLMDKFDLCYEVPVSRNAHIHQDRYFVFPYLLSSRVPTESLVVWPLENPEDLDEYSMHLDVFTKELPLGLFEKILVRANEFLDYSVSWKQGMVAFCNGGVDLVKLEVLSNEKKPTNYWSLASANQKPWSSSQTNWRSWRDTQTLPANKSSGAKTPTPEAANGSAGASDHVLVEVAARAAAGRADRAAHVLMLLVAVVNRIILHHYPGTVALWYVLCPVCVKRRNGNQVSDAHARVWA